jgi:3',5'-cyclic AMP phosphodiesterase CpdA
MFTLAHLTDVHLSPLPSAKPGEIMGQRLPGYLNWIGGRKSFHTRETLDRLTADLRTQGADHITVTGDLTNISLPLEFRRAAGWLRDLGPPDRVTVVPGNHDAYVHVPAETGLGHWSAYMASDDKGAAFVPRGQAGFPFVRIVGEVALIGLSSAFPTWPFMATGRLQARQIEALRTVLERLRGQDLFKTVLVHHPPLPGMADWRRGLRDAAALQEVLRDLGPDLVLHGHNHQHSHVILESPEGPVPIIGAASASVGREGSWALAAYHLYEISRGNGGWVCEMSVRGLAAPGDQVRELDRVTITG